jgi:hypothetical protein
MANQSQPQSRRHFLTQSLATCTAIGTTTLLGPQLFADRIEIAGKIAETDETHVLAPALKLASESLKSLDQLKDYTSIFSKTERIGRNLIHSRMELKLRETPFSVYVKFLQPNAGREVLYVEGTNNNYLRVRDVGFASLAGTLSLDPKGSTAMDGNRYPITSIGMRNLLIKLVETWLAERAIPGMAVNIFPNTRMDNQTCQMIEVSHRQHHPGAKFQLTRLFIDTEHQWPIRLQAFDFPGNRDKEAPLAEDYFYARIQPNVGLTDFDFSTKNPKYRF